MHVLGSLTFALVTLTSLLALAADDTITVTPAEDPDVVLRNPDMGWVLYENYPLDPRPGGSSTLVNLPDEDFPAADHVALMFAWSDVETAEGAYDWSKVDHAYDYWKKRAKQIQLRMSTESLLWWNHLDPPSGLGVPPYVLERLPADKRQIRDLVGVPYTVVDAREPYDLERLDAFLAEARRHFGRDRPVTLIDLRGFGVWGEWHAGYAYATLEDRRAALKAIIDHWSAAFPEHCLSLSYSHDPDGSKELYAGPHEKYDPAATATYDAFLRFSAFDHALTKRNITWRRDGAGGAVYSNQRKLCDATFARLDRGPFMSEFCGGYLATKPGGAAWQKWMVDDALSLHPNYVNLLGWQAGDALAFCRERPDLVDKGLRTMGYRLVPLSVSYPATLEAGRAFRVQSTWANRAVGRAMRDFRLTLCLVDAKGRAAARADAGEVGTSRWVKGQANTADVDATFAGVAPGEYTLHIALDDLATGTRVALPLFDATPDRTYPIGPVRISPTKG